MVDQICLWPQTDTVWVSLAHCVGGEKDVQGPGCCSGRWDLGPVWEGEQAAPTCICACPYAVLLPSYLQAPLQLFAVLTPSCLQFNTSAICSHYPLICSLILRSVQSPPQLFSRTDICSRHPDAPDHLPSCLQLPPSALYNLSPAVCSHYPR